MADIFDEVGEDLRAEQARMLLLRYGGVVIVLVIAVLVGVAGWQAWRWREGQRADRAALVYFDAMRDADKPATDTAAHAEAITLFDRVVTSGPASYRTLARLRAAALRDAAGDAPAAVALWDAVAADPQADPLLRGLANLLWARHGIDAGDPVAVAARFKPLLMPDNAWHGLAQEGQALLELRLGHKDAAREGLRRLAITADIPEDMRGRANILLSGLGT